MILTQERMRAHGRRADFFEWKRRGELKDYQPKKLRQYVLPHNTYMEVLYIIRSYDMLKQECADILVSSPDPEEGPSGSGISNQPLAYVIRTEEKTKRIDAVDKALGKVPPEYRKGVLDNIITRKPFPKDAARSTYSYWKQRVIFYVAKYLNLL